ncbi:MAG: restriction endonuclease [Pseudomonadota bacterium]
MCDKRVETLTEKELISLIQKDNSYIYKILPRQFEEVIAELFRAQGFNVELTKRTRDGGKDIIATHNAMGIDTRYLTLKQLIINKRWY